LVCGVSKGAFVICFFYIMISDSGPYPTQLSHLPLYHQSATPVPSYGGSGGRGISRVATSLREGSTTTACYEETIDERVKFHSAGVEVMCGDNAK